VSSIVVPSDLTIPKLLCEVCGERRPAAGFHATIPEIQHNGGIIVGVHYCEQCSLLARDRPMVLLAGALATARTGRPSEVVLAFLDQRAKEIIRHDRKQWQRFRNRCNSSEAPCADLATVS
jgi:hypothetical protein